MSAYFFVVFSGGLSFPSMIPLLQQHMEWYSLPSGHGLRGTNICPGHMYFFVHDDLDLSRQFTNLRSKFFYVTVPYINQISNAPELIFIGRWFRIIVSYCTNYFVEPLFQSNSICLFFFIITQYFMFIIHYCSFIKNKKKSVGPSSWI